MNRRSRVEIDMGPVSGSRRRGLTRPMLKPFHRAAEVMQQEGISLRAIISRMNISAEQARAELDPRRDMRLSELYRWQAALNVPVVDLLVDPGTGLSGSVELRAELLKLMKSVRSIQEKSEDEVIDRLAARLASQLMEIMPELKDVSSWPSVGQPRTLDDLGAIVERILPEAFFNGSPPTRSFND